ncbi:hypothetical protein [Thermicanus aegyptius]|uniref:hypothetical protein n=1 Tax=Thermicanus aegyptius TaxID=94009 RepID=UPI00041E1E55|nr:hypothetical protein [Thermicanus aegyptius]
MAEKNLLAFFKSPEQAKEAKEILEKIGVDTIQIDDFSRYPAEDREDVRQTLSGDFAGLADLTEEKVPTGKNEAILMAADPLSSGMSVGNGIVTGYHILLTAVMEEEKHQEAINIVRGLGAII